MSTSAQIYAQREGGALAARTGFTQLVSLTMTAGATVSATASLPAGAWLDAIRLETPAAFSGSPTNYREDHWANGSLARTCAAEAGVLTYPIMVDAAGAVWKHESGFSYAGAATPYIESGPMELDLPNGPGFEVFECVGVKPDALTLGDVQLTFYGRFEPLGTEYAYGPYALSNAPSIRFQARQARVRATALTTGDWRLGVLRMDTRPAGQR